MRKPDNADVGLREDCEEDLADVGHNADLYWYLILILILMRRQSGEYRFDPWSAQLWVWGTLRFRLIAVGQVKIYHFIIFSVA